MTGAVNRRMVYTLGHSTLRAVLRTEHEGPWAAAVREACDRLADFEGSREDVELVAQLLRDAGHTELADATLGILEPRSTC